jgi:hypothetical protein
LHCSNDKEVRETPWFVWPSKGNDTMAYTPSAVAPREFSYPQAATAKIAKRGLWARLLHAMMESRQRQADAEIAHYLQNIGEKFTDATEREIECRFLSK